MKYWPLTAVLLAFWLGRETGAEKPATEVREFDVIRCNSIIVGDKDRRTTIVPGAVTCKKGVLLANVGPGEVFVESPGFRAAMKTEGDNAHIEAEATGTGFGAVIGAGNKGAWHGLTCVVRDGGQLVQGPSIGSSISKDGAKMMVADTGGRDRVVIGSRASTITLYDAEGNVMTQLPKKQ